VRYTVGRSFSEIEQAVERGLERHFEEMEEWDRRQDQEGILIRREKVVELTRKIQRLTRKREKVKAAKEFLETHRKRACTWAMTRIVGCKRTRGWCSLDTTDKTWWTGRTS
jgi:hypothetical protein